MKTSMKKALNTAMFVSTLGFGVIGAGLAVANDFDPTGGAPTGCSGCGNAAAPTTTISNDISNGGDKITAWGLPSHNVSWNSGASQNPCSFQNTDGWSVGLIINASKYKSKGKADVRCDWRDAIKYIDKDINKSEGAIAAIQIAIAGQQDAVNAATDDETRVNLQANLDYLRDVELTAATYQLNHDIERRDAIVRKFDGASVQDQLDARDTERAFSELEVAEAVNVAVKSGATEVELDMMMRMQEGIARYVVLGKHAKANRQKAVLVNMAEKIIDRYIANPQVQITPLSKAPVASVKSGSYLGNQLVTTDSHQDLLSFNSYADVKAIVAQAEANSTQANGCLMPKGVNQLSGVLRVTQAGVLIKCITRTGIYDAQPITDELHARLKQKNFSEAGSRITMRVEN